MEFVYIILILLCFYIIFLAFKSFGKNEFNMFGFNFCKYTLGWFFRLWYPFKTENKKVIPKDGPVLFCGNHIHLMDQCLAILSTGRPVHYMAKVEYFTNPKTRWFFKMAGCIPVNRQIKDENAKSAALEVLNKGLALGIFPEGTRNKTKDFLLPFKFGAVSMAKKTDAYIVPVGITGDYKFRSKNLVTRIGKPFKINNLSLEEANNKLKDEISSLMKQNLKDNK